MLKVRPNKILFDPKIFYLQKYGGISKYIVELVQNLDKTKFDPKIIAPIYINEYLRKVSSVNKKTFYKISKHPRFTRKISTIINDNIFNLFANLEKPKIIHSTYYEKINYKKKTGLVVSVYDLIHEIFEKKFYNNYVKTIKQKSLNLADRIICISNSTRNDLLKYYDVDEKKISVIYLGQETNKNIEVIEDNFLKVPYLLYVGDRRKYKNFINFVEAYSISKILKNNFNIVCFGNENFNKIEIEFFKKKKIDLNKIKFYSGNSNNLNYIYKKAALYICPSLYEGFGLTILEAMNMDCPIIASDKGSIIEVGKDIIDYFDPYSPEDIAKRIEKLIFDEERKINMINRYQEHLSNFLWKKTASQTEKVYEEIL